MDALDKEPLAGGAHNGSGQVNGAAAAPNPQPVASANLSIAQLLRDSAGPSSPRRAAGGSQQVDSELNLIGLAIEDLQDRLEKANARLGNVEYMEATEFEIGRLLVEAERSSASALAHLEAKVYEVLIELDAKATKILAEATEEANQIRQKAQDAACAALQSTHDLQAAVAGFISANAELLKDHGGPSNVLVSATPADVTQAVGQTPT
jgi:hypothetical protein